MEGVMNAYEKTERASYQDFITRVRAGGNLENEILKRDFNTPSNSRVVVDAAYERTTQHYLAHGAVIDRQLDPASLNHLRAHWGKACRKVDAKIRAEYKDAFEAARDLAEAAEAAVERERKAVAKNLKKANRRRGVEAVPVAPPTVPVVVAAAPVVAAPDAAPDIAAIDLEVDLANKAARRLKLATPKILRNLTTHEPPAIGASEEVAPIETGKMQRRRLRDTTRLHAKQHRENEQHQEAMNEYTRMRKAIGDSYVVERLQPDSDPIATIEKELNAALLADAKKGKAKAKAKAHAKARAEAVEVRTSIFV